MPHQHHVIARSESQELPLSAGSKLKIITPVSGEDQKCRTSIFCDSWKWSKKYGDEKGNGEGGDRKGGASLSILRGWVFLYCTRVEFHTVFRGHPKRPPYAAEGEVLEYVCPPTHALKGPNNVTCLKNGQWTKPPHCELCCEKVAFGICLKFHKGVTRSS